MLEETLADLGLFLSFYVAISIVTMMLQLYYSRERTRISGVILWTLSLILFFGLFASGIELLNAYTSNPDIQMSLFGFIAISVFAFIFSLDKTLVLIDFGIWFPFLKDVFKGFTQNKTKKVR